MTASRVLAWGMLAAGLLSPAQEPPALGSRDIRGLSIKADALLRRERGERLEIDEANQNTHSLRRATNRVHWNSSTKDNRLVSITIEPVGDETEGTTSLAAVLLVTLEAVESYDEAVRITAKVRDAEKSDGRPRQVTLKNGIRLLRLRPDHDRIVYRIAL